MSRSRFSIAPGQARTLTIAGVPFRVRVDPAARRAVALPASYEPFATRDGSGGLDIVVVPRDPLPSSRGTLLYDSELHWRAYRDGATLFAIHHPPTSLTYCRAKVNDDFTRAEIQFSEGAWRGIVPSRDDDVWEIPYPLDQLLMVPALARRGVVLFHAGGAVLSNRALVFAGHSGDGKTTITGLLEREGLELLSDERIAIERTGEGFVAHGTPWPGEGNVVSRASRPLGGLFVLRKALSHHLANSPPSVVVPELLSRAIVPYYLPETASRILEILDELQAACPPKDLHFALEPGLSSLLGGVLSAGVDVSA